MRTPSATAVRSGRARLTYQELSARTTLVARRLASLGIGPEAIVGVAVPRSVDTVVALLGVLKSGGAFMPLDTGLPAARLTFMLRDAAPRVVIASRATAPLLPPGTNLLMLEDVGHVGASRRESAAALDGCRIDTSRALAYVIYTSGTTGAPKAVMVEHGALASFCQAIAADFPFQRGDRHVAIANVAFDISVFELLGPLCSGGEVIVAEQAEVMDPAALAALIEHSEATSVQATPSHWALLVGLLRRKSPPLRIAVGGEALPHALAARLLSLAPKMWNLYGPTEATVWASVSPVTQDVLDREASPIVGIGKPLASHTLYVLDANLMLAPVGALGELYIAGPALSRGYLKRPGLTAARFVANPYGKPGERMYRAGDLARWSADGTLEYLGRADRQVKIRGLRIELAEIEHALRAHAGVRDAVVLVEQHDVAPRLTACVLPAVTAREREAGRGPVTPEALKGHLAGLLPHYMVPSAIVIVEAWPLTPNGKLDRDALPTRRVEDKAASSPPRTPLQAQLCAIFASLLGRRDVAIEDDFFELGGHSLLVMHALVRIHELLGAIVTVREFFARPTVMALSAYIQESEDVKGREASQSEAITRLDAPRSSRRRVPLSFNQEQHMIRLLMTREQSTRAPSLMNITLRLSGALDVRSLERAVAEVVRRHEILRTRFRASASTRLLARIGPAFVKLSRFGWVRRVGRALVAGAIPRGDMFYQDVVRDASIHLRLVDLRGFTPAEFTTAMYRLPEMTEPFDFAAPPLLRAVLLRTTADDHVLILVVSHMAFDEWSENILKEEVLALYEAFAAGRESPLPELPIQYGDFATWERRRVTGERLTRSLEEWRTLVPGDASPLHMKELPFHERSSISRYRASEVGVSLGVAATAAATQVCRTEHVTMFVLLLAGLNVTLHRASGREQIGVWAGFANRVRPEAQHLIGWFARWHLISTRIGATDSFRDVLRAMREVVLSAIAVQEIPVPLLVLHGVLDISSPEFGARPHVAFQFRTEPGPAAESRARAEKALSVTEGPAYRGLPTDCALKINVAQRADDLHIRVAYSTDWFTEKGATELLRAYTRVLNDLIADPSTRAAAPVMVPTGHGCSISA